MNSEYVREKIVKEERSHLLKALREGSREHNLSMQIIVKKLVNFVENAVDELESEEGVLQPDD